MNVFIPDTTPMTAEEIQEIRENMGVSQFEMGENIGIHEKTWRLWEKKGCSPAWSFLVREFVDGAIGDIGQMVLPASVVCEIIELAGGHRETCDALGISKSTLTAWKKRGAPGQSGWGRALQIMAELNGIDVGGS